MGSSDEVARALQRYREESGDFAVYLIGELAAAAGCAETVTFDRALTGAEGFLVL